MLFSIWVSILKVLEMLVLWHFLNSLESTVSGSYAAWRVVCIVCVNILNDKDLILLIFLSEVTRSTLKGTDHYVLWWEASCLYRERSLLFDWGLLNVLVKKGEFILLWSGSLLLWGLHSWVHIVERIVLEHLRLRIRWLQLLASQEVLGVSWIVYLWIIVRHEVSISVLDHLRRCTLNTIVNCLLQLRYRLVKLPVNYILLR